MLILRYLTIYLLVTLCFGCSQQASKRVLVIHSYEDSYVGYPEFNALIQKEFKKNKINADIRTFYLDCERYMEKAEIRFMNGYLDSLTDWKPEVILVNDDQATYSLLKTKHPILKNIPIVFTGVNYPNWGLIHQYPNLTGFYDKMDILANIQVIREFCKNKSEVFTIVDSTFIDRRIRADLKEQFRDNDIWLVDETLSLEEQQKKLKEGFILFSLLGIRTRPNGDNIFWSLSKFASHSYLQLKRDYTTQNVSMTISSICFSAINETLGFDGKILAGYMTTMPIQVEEGVSLASELLRGKKVIDYPVRESRKEYVVDWEVAKRRNFTQEDIPLGYKIINMPIYQRYPVASILTITTLLFFVICVFCYVIFLYRREGQRRALAMSELEAERESLALAIQGGSTYAWKVQNGFMEIEDSFWENIEKKPRRLTSMTVMEFISPDQRDLCVEYLTYFRKTGKYTIEFLCDFNDRGLEWWEFRFSTFLKSNNTFRTAGLMQNIQNIKNRERELIEARELAEKAELKQSFLANMSHEIRTPLNAIVGFSNILTVEDLSEEERKQYIEIINTNSGLLLKLINDILELSRIESGYMSFKFERCNIRELFNDVYATHKMLIPPYLSFNKEEDNRDIYINVDPGRLVQVISNLVNNASKFTKEGYIKMSYHYDADCQKVYIAVEDTGKGISKAEQKMIFNRFYKQDEFAQGTGLGLSICKVIIERLNGKIELISEIGQGSCFTIILSAETE